MTAVTPTPMLTASYALEQLLAAIAPPQQLDYVPTESALGRILAKDLVSGIAVPPQDNTQMDGYAVRSAECQTLPVELPVSQRIPAGQLPSALDAGSVARIFTGAFIPPGADAVVMQEQVETTEVGVKLTQAISAGQWIRRKGEDIAPGQTVLTAGQRLRAQDLGLAASIGLAQIPVWRPLKVAIFFTGDELCMPGESLPPGAIYNSNRYFLRGLLQGLGCEVTDFGIVPDQLAASRQVLRQAAEQHDLILSSGGVSVGEEDHMKAAVIAEGELKLWQIAIKPGKPLAFGRVAQSHFIGLPGNPVSAFVTFLLFVRPFILRANGVHEVQPKSIAMRADFNWSKADKRNEFLRARINQQGGLDLFANQGSAVLTSTVWADGLINLAPAQTIQAGQLVNFIPFNALV